MKRIKLFIVTGVMMLLSIMAVQATPLEISLQPDHANPDQPVMGDKMRFRSVITNTGIDPIEGLVGWISLVEVDPGREQPWIWKTGAPTRRLQAPLWLRVQN